MTIVHDPENLDAINELWAYVSEDDRGRHGLVGLPLNGFSLPAVFGYRQTADQFEGLVKALSKLTEKKIKLVKFVKEQEIKTL